ncbi:MAG: 16S rRNA (uracil(1498)-N(3))-methyltransferase [Clostridium sp.]|nr:16S rRNA (uracil(1498)-N(3))-methyltransferase [Clostridium sp.]MCM1548143.1 16S rRNA (uracil(1498)-N(3))-methyltransferase [Ruminococcus sp.]
MPRFFLDNIDAHSPVIIGDDARHIGFSLRMKPGERITVCSNGIDYDCAIKQITGDTVFLEIKESIPCAAEPSINLTLYQALPKLDKLETIVQKAIELGVSEIVPVMTRRCISRPSQKDFSKKLERLRKIALAAAKQSGRGIIPDISPLIDFRTAVSQMSETQCPVMLYENGGSSFSELKTENKTNFSVLVGSEGGFDPEEAEYAKNSGIIPIWLGNRILRCETAPLAAISILMFITKNL